MKEKEYEVTTKINIIMDFQGYTENIDTLVSDIKLWLNRKLNPHSIGIEIIKSKDL